MNIRIAFLCIFAISLLPSCGNSLNMEPPLHAAAMNGELAKVKELIKNGANIEGLNSEGATALHWAAFKGKLEVATYLLNSGANVNAQTTKGSTPLRLATTHKQDALIKLLKQRGGRE